MIKLSELVLEKNPDKDNQAAFAVLDRCAENFFPSEAFIAANLKMLSRESKNNKDSYEAMFLPFHTRDEKWLAQFTEKVYKMFRNLQRTGDTEINKNLGNIELPEIDTVVFQNYVKSSPVFDLKRTEYELRLVKVCIDLAVNEKISDFFTSADAKVKLRDSIKYEWIVRDRINRMANFLNLPQNVIDDGIELNADEWRPTARRITFNNNFNPRGILLKNDHAWLRDNEPEVLQSIRHMENEFYKSWDKYQEYYNYQDHYEVLERLNKVTPCMKMSPTEAEQLRQRNIQLAETYKAALRECDEKFPILGSLRNPQQPEPTIIL